MAKASQAAGFPEEAQGGSVRAVKVVSGLQATGDCSKLTIPNPFAST